MKAQRKTYNTEKTGRKRKRKRESDAQINSIKIMSKNQTKLILHSIKLYIIYLVIHSCIFIVKIAFASFRYVRFERMFTFSFCCCCCCCFLSFFLSLFAFISLEWGKLCIATFITRWSKRLQIYSIDWLNWIRFWSASNLVGNELLFELYIDPALKFTFYFIFLFSFLFFLVFALGFRNLFWIMRSISIWIGFWTFPKRKTNKKSKRIQYSFRGYIFVCLIDWFGLFLYI